MTPEDPIVQWKARAGDCPAGGVRVVLADVDGVITAGEGQPADLPLLARLMDINRTALVDPQVPAVTLCTGRPAPYVEALAQMIGAFLPCIFEHGAGLFYPRSFQYVFSPALGSDYAANLANLRGAVEPLLRSGLAFVQPGKEASMTLYPLGSASFEALLEAATAAAAPLGGFFTVEPNATAVEVRPRGIDKGTGARWLAEVVDVPLAEFAGVGDSATDLPFLRVVGHPAAPANAAPAVRAEVADIASACYAEGLLEIVGRLASANKLLANPGS